MSLFTGALTEEHELAAYMALGESLGVRLVYDSLRTDPRPIVNTSFTDVDPLALAGDIADQLRVTASLTVQRGGFVQSIPGNAGGEFGLLGGENFWTLPEEAGPIEAALQIDLSEEPSGIYTYNLSSGIRLFSEFNQRFVGSSTRSSGTLMHVNSVDSSLGAGWGIAGLQQIIENPDGSVLLVNGDGSELAFSSPQRFVRDLLIQDIPNNAVSRYDGVTGEFIEYFVAPGAGGLAGPHNPTFGPDGNLYVFSSAAPAKILRFDGETGDFIDVFVDNGGPAGFNGGSGMTFGEDGVLYVSTSGLGAGVQKFDPSGQFLGNIATAAQGSQASCWTEFGPDGLLYVWDTFDEEMRRFDPTTGDLIDVFIPPGNALNSCNFEFGPDGDIYLTDASYQQIRRFSGVNGEFLDVFASANGFVDGITLGPDNNFYVAVSGVTYRFDGETGEFLEIFVPDNSGYMNFFPETGVPQGTQLYESPDGDFSVLEQLPDGGFRRTLTNQTEYLFDSTGRLRSVVDRNGNETSYEYDSQGVLLAIVDPVGLRTSLRI